MLTYRDNERVHTELRIVGILLCKTWIDDIVYAVDRDTRFGDVRGDDNLACARRRGIEDPRLHFRWEGGVNGKDHELWDLRSQSLYAFVEDFARRVDLLLPSEEEQDVACGLHEVNLEDSDQRSLEIIGFWLFCIQRLDRESPPRYRKNGTPPKISCKLGSVKGCRGADELEVGPSLTGL